MSKGKGKSSFKSKNYVSSTRPPKLLHMDLFGPTRIIVWEERNMVWSSLMTMLDLHEVSSLPTKVSISLCFRYSTKEYRWNSVYISQISYVTLVLSLKMESFGCSINLMAYTTVSLHQEHTSIK